MKSMYKSNVPHWVQAMYRLNNYLSRDFLGGPKLLKLAWVINLQKGGTIFFVAFLMLWYRNGSTAAWVYLALHGSYGFCWLIKHANFPDSRWEQRVTFGAAAIAFLLVLGPYWLFPYLLISDALGSQRPVPPNALLALCIMLHTLGVALMMSADAQKYYTLKYRAGLIDEGLFKRIRHPNYLGEMMAYSAYALLVQHWIPWAILATIWTGFFLVNMRMKEDSLARYPEWEAYRARTGMLLPRVLGSRDSAPPSLERQNEA